MSTAELERQVERAQAGYDSLLAEYVENRVAERRALDMQMAANAAVRVIQDDLRVIGAKMLSAQATVVERQADLLKAVEDKRMKEEDDD